jgi:WD40 repeat protein
LRYLKNHKTWITLGSDNIIREYDLKKAEPLILTIEGHKRSILDVIELQHPFAIASASLDCTIRIYSLVDKEEISVLAEH